MTLVGFISFIMYFVIRMNTEDRADHELVTEDYYEQELAYQKEIDAKKNAAELKAKLVIAKSEEGLIVNFPENFNPKKITGKVSLYRPSDRHLDFNFPISLSNTHLHIPDNRLIDGRWDIAIKWQHEGKTFLHKEKLVY